MDKNGNFKDLVKVEELLDTLPNSNNTKLLYYVLKIRFMSIDFAYDKNALIDLSNSILSIENPNFQEKVLYFDTINSQRKSMNYLEFTQLNNLVVDILAGTDISSKFPFNSVVLYARLDKFRINFEKQTISTFAKALGYTGEMMGLKSLENIRPMFRPLTKKFVNDFAKRHNLNSENFSNLKRIRRMIAKEYFRLFYWKQLNDKYGSLESINTLRFLEFEYKCSSTIYQLYYGETREEILLEYKAYKRRREEYQKVLRKKIL